MKLYIYILSIFHIYFSLKFTKILFYTIVMKIKRNPSPNYAEKTRKKTRVKFVIIHYTGMQSEIESINR